MSKLDMLLKDIIPWTIFAVSLVVTWNDDIFTGATSQHECMAEFPRTPVKISAAHDAQLCNATACQKRYRVAVWYNEPFAIPPGMFSPHGKERPGFFQDVIDKMMKSCCGSCANYSITTIVSDPDSLSHLAKNGSADLVYPVLGETTSSSVHGSSFVPLKFIPGGTLLYIKDQSAKTFISELTKAVLEVWPLVIVSLLLAFVAGVIIWFMDTWFNVEEFPRSFVRGSLEGFWWAFVSMTTVGYGDRSPKSMHARVFAVIWILMGITIFSMLTASLTTAITSVVVQGPPSIYGLKVGVISTHMYEIGLGSAQNAKLNYYNDMKSLTDAFVNKDIEAILLDRFSMVFHWQNHFKGITGAETSDIKDEKMTSAYGFLVPQKESFNYFKKFLEFNKQTIEIHMARIINTMASKITRATDEGNSVFSTKSGLFYYALYASIGTLFVIVVGGFIYEVFRKRKKHAKTSIASKDGISEILRKAEDGMILEVRELIQTWDSRLRDIIAEQKSSNDQGTL